LTALDRLLHASLWRTYAAFRRELGGTMRASLALEANLAFRELGERSLFVPRRRGWMSFSGPPRRPFGCTTRRRIAGQKKRRGDDFCVRVRPEAGASRHK